MINILIVMQTFMTLFTFIYSVPHFSDSVVFLGRHVIPKAYQLHMGGCGQCSGGLLLYNVSVVSYMESK